MARAKIAVSLDSSLVEELDRLVRAKLFESRSQAIQEAVRDKLDRFRRRRLARECAKLDRAFEKSLADEGLSDELSRWPEY